jgi:hypothetical protein
MSNDDIVLSPGGYRPISSVKKLNSRNILKMADNHLRIVDLSGNLIYDVGEIRTNANKTHLFTRNLRSIQREQSELDSGWITFASWTNMSSIPVSYFSTTWLVPPHPSSHSGQTIFLFNGIENSQYNFILQPVLQWGLSAAGGGNYWSIASWYVGGQDGPAFHTELIRVNPGTRLTGIMALTESTNSSFSYDCYFKGIPNTNLPIRNVDELVWCNETLEAYGVTRCTDYPNVNSTLMSSIDIRTFNLQPLLNWEPIALVRDCGQRTIIHSNSNPNGQIELYYH